MVGKSNTSSDDNALDLERAASMADEGGAAGAEMESQNPDEGPRLASLHLFPARARKVVGSGSINAWIGGALVLTGMVAAVAFTLFYRDRAERV